MRNKKIWIFLTLTSIFLMQPLKAAERFVTNDSNGFKWIQEGKSCPILVDNKEYNCLLYTSDAADEL